MMSSLKHVTQKISLGMCALVLAVLLAACGGTAVSPTPTPTPKPPTPTPTPTPVTTQTYSGTSFSIGYPTGWTPVDQQGLGVAITDTLKINAVTVIDIPLPLATETADQVAAGETTTLIPLVIKGAQPITTVASTTSLAGDTWVQKAFTGTVSQNGQDIKARIYMLVDIHPAGGKAFIILYGGPDATFDTFNTTYFQPMLKSFKFTS